MKNPRLLACVVAFAITGSSIATAEEATGDARRGKVLYERNCISCHGAVGDGKGEVAEWVTPKPRDYRQGIFKCRSTPSGSLPLASDLEKTIKDGIYGTYMPGWYALGHRSRRDLIAYIQGFSSRWNTEKPQDPIPVPSEPLSTTESVQRGKGIYDQNGCASCHGDGGLGDGSSSRGLTDDWGNPILVANLTEGRLKCGNSGADIYRELMTGLNGTPMPAYLESIKPDEAWDLVHYIQSLSPRYPKKLSSR